MQKSTVDGSHGTGVEVGGDGAEAGRSVTPGRDSVSEGAVTAVVVGIPVGMGAHAVSRKSRIRKVGVCFIFCHHADIGECRDLPLFFFASLANFAAGG